MDNYSTSNLSIEKIRNKILFYIKYRFRTKYEIINKLKKINASPEQIQQIVSELEHLELINDEKFIHNFVKEYIEIKKLGLSRVKAELKHIGFDTGLIELSINQYIDQESYIPEEEAIKFLHCKYSFKAELPEDHKILGQLMRKGYSYSIADKALKAYKNQHINN